MLGLHGLVQWMGTEQALDAALAVQARLMNATPEMLAGFTQADEPQDPFVRVGEVAVIPVKGSLVNSDSPWLAFFGIGSYPQIRRAIVAAATDSSIKHILLDIDSGGGHVSGAQDTADLISRVNAKVKPITTFANNMCSAAYWLGCHGRQISASSTGVIGSIGVLMVHIEYTEMMEKDGVKATVIRSAPNKALMNPYEKLTDKARAQAEAEIGEVHRVFTQSVADALGESYGTVDTKMGQGRTFVGQMAVDIGLADSVSTFDGVLSKLQKQKAVDNSSAIYDNGILKRSDKTMDKKATLTDQEIALAAAGAEVTAAAPSAAEVAAAEAAAVVAAAATAAAPAAAAPAAAAPAADTKETPAAGSELVTFLQAQLKDKDAALLQANIDLKAAQAKLTDADASQSPLVDIARKAISNMQVALGGTAADLAAQPAAAVLAEYARVSALFTAKFKVGGVAAVSATEKTTVVKPLNAVEQAGLRAARFAKK